MSEDIEQITMTVDEVRDLFVYEYAPFLPYRDDYYEEQNIRELFIKRLDLMIKLYCKKAIETGKLPEL